MKEKLYVLGYPVGHSKSPAMHNAAYAALGLDWNYDFADYPDAVEACAFIDQHDWLALNVTTPYKPLALERALFCSASALLAKGANVLVNHSGELHADNVDGKGCVAFLRRQGVCLEGTRVAVCGTGPTSLSIMHACSQVGATQVSLLSRDADKVQLVLAAYKDGLAGLARDSSETRFVASSYEEGGQELSEAYVIIDATPLGMHNGDPAPFDTGCLSEGQVVVDVVYGHGTTALIGAAQVAGCAAFDGSGMLVGQAVETVRGIAELTGLFSIPESIDLYEVMANAAGFEA